MTEHIYYADPCKREIETSVQQIRKGSRYWEIVCDRTIFYPEGGGQPGDRGRIGETAVVGTIRKNDEIVHLAESKPDLLEGEAYRMVLDWEHRFDYMQQHSGQHILSAVFYRELQIQTVSVHQGEAYVTIELSCDELSGEELEAVEEQANYLVRKNIPITAYTVQEDEALELDLRREPKVSGEIRIVQIGDYDSAACGGIHTERTSDVGWIACIGTEKIRGHVRTLWKIGKRTVRDFHQKTKLLDELGTLLSAPMNQTAEACRKQLDKLKEAEYYLEQERRKLAKVYALQAVENADHLTGNVLYITAVLHNEDPQVLRTIYEHLDDAEHILLRRMGDRGEELNMHRAPKVFCGIVETESDIRWLIGTLGDIDLDFGKIRTDLFPLIEGKGGGKAPLRQGIGRNPKGMRAFLSALREMIKSQQQMHQKDNA